MKHKIDYQKSMFHQLPKRMILLVLLTLLVPSPVYAEYGDVVLNNRAEKAGVRPVVFPHWFHRIRFKCNVCHTEIGFKMRAGADDIHMTDIKDGKFCGACHNKQIAWGPEKCDLCHSGLAGLKTGTSGGNATGGPGKW
jgi:c(7)-type cytochrome triheme protein